MKKSFVYHLFVVCVLIGVGCSTRTNSPRQRVAFTSITTHAYFAQRIVGDRYDIRSLIDAYTDPHTFTPLPAQVVKLSQASLFFRAGIEFEQGFLPNIAATMQGVEVVDLRQGITLFASHKEKCSSEDHHHAHGTTDPHVWLAPLLAKKQASILCDAFKKADPAFASRYTDNFTLLATELDSLDAFLQKTFKDLHGTALFVFHPAFRYFAQAYGLHQVAVQADGKEPGARALARLIEEVQHKNIKLLFVQPQYPQKSVAAIARQTKCTVIPIPSMPEDYFVEMRALGSAVRQGLMGE